MKKIFITISIILISIFLSNYIINNKDKLLNKLFVDSNDDLNIYYFIQEGVYDDKDILEDNINKTYPYIIDYSNNKFYVYLGITKDLEVVKKLEDIFTNHGISIYLKKKELNSDEFYNNIIQFDLLSRATSDEDELLTIEEVVLANYEEIFKNM
jgi:hypothetical protein